MPLILVGVEPDKVDKGEVEREAQEEEAAIEAGEDTNAENET